MIVVGVDPGITGALSIFDRGHCEAVHDMPVFDTRVDGRAVAELLTSVEPDVVVIEDTQPMPKNGSIASFKLGLNTGIVLGVAQAEGFSIWRVRPAMWKRWNGLTGKPKDACRGLVVELFPDMAERVRLVKHQGRADAILIGRYGVYQNIHTAKEAPDVPKQARGSEVSYMWRDGADAAG